MDLSKCIDNIRSFFCCKRLSGRFIGRFLSCGFKQIMYLLLTKNYKSTVVFLTFFCISAIHAYAQFDPLFSQNMFNLLNNNPGYAGSREQVNVLVVNRNQWTGLDGAPVTTVVGADAPLEIFGKKAGVGFEIMNDKIGLFTNLTIKASVSRQILFSEGTLGIGGYVAVINQKFDGSGVSIPNSDFHEQNDPLIPTTEVNGYTPDFGLGAFFHDKNEKWYSGFSIQHLFAPKPNFQDDFYVYVHRSLFFTGGYTYQPEDRRYTLKPSIFGRVGGGSWQIDWNVNVDFGNKYWLGLSYRFQDAVVLLGGVRFSNGMWAGYSYDITTSALGKSGSSGSHEIVMGYSFDLKINKKNNRYKSVRFL